MPQSFIAGLLRSARRIMRRHGHKPGKTYAYSPGWRGISCTTCKREIQVHDCTQDGSLTRLVGITGYAGEINCEGE